MKKLQKNELLDAEIYLQKLIEAHQTEKTFAHLGEDDEEVKPKIIELYDKDDFMQLYAPILKNIIFSSSKICFEVEEISLECQSGHIYDVVKLEQVRTRNFGYNLVYTENWTLENMMKLKWFRFDFNAHNYFEDKLYAIIAKRHGLYRRVCGDLRFDKYDNPRPYSYMMYFKKNDAFGYFR